MFDWCLLTALRLELEAWAEALATDWRYDGRFFLDEDLEWEVVRLMWEQLHQPPYEHRAWRAALLARLEARGVLAAVDATQLVSEHYGRSFGTLSHDRLYGARDGRLLAFGGWPAP